MLKNHFHLLDLFNFPPNPSLLFGYQKESGPSVMVCGSSQPHHASLSPLPFHFMELDLIVIDY